jgi:exosortase
MHKGRTILGVGVIVAVVGVLFFGVPYYTGYYPPKKTLAKGMWQLANYRSGEWTHCMFVPFILCALLWWRRRDFVGLTVSPSWLGGPVLLVSCLLYWVGYKSDVHYFGWAAVHGLLVGAVLWLFGLQWFRAFFFYLAFLCFMWPLLFLESSLAVPLRYIMVHAASATMSAVGIENLSVGTAIVSAADVAEGLAQGERFQLDVADPCSGIRSLFALMMISGLYGFITLKGFWKPSVLFLASLPLAVAGNLVRILLLLFGVLGFGNEVAIGPEGAPSLYHLMAGFAVFAVALIGMVGVASVLRGSRPWRRSVGQVRKAQVPSAN